MMNDEDMDSTAEHPAEPSRFSWKPIALGAVLVLGCVSHLPYVINGYGEQDSVHTGILITLWAQDGEFPTEAGEFVAERFRSNPLYVYALKSLVAGGVIARAQLASVMSWITAVCGIGIICVSFFLLRALIGRAEATLAVILLLTSPVFFESRCYGFPTLPALLLMLGSVTAFLRAHGEDRLRYGWTAAAAVYLILAVMTKADIILLWPALPVVSLHWKRTRYRKRAIAAACSMGVLSLLAWHFFCAGIAPNAPGTGQTYAWWSQRWPVYPAGLVEPGNLLRMAMAPGMGTAVAFVLAAGICLGIRRTRMAAFATLACVGPTILFWGMRELNSSRHNLWIVLPAASLVGILLWREIRPVWLRVGLVAAICSANTLLGPTKTQWGTAPAHFLQAAKRNQQLTHRINRDCALALRQHIPNGKLCFFRNASPSWIAGNAAAVSERIHFDKTGQAGTNHEWEFTIRIEGEHKRVWVPYAKDSSNRTFQRIASEGWTAIIARQGNPPFLRLLPNGMVPWPTPTGARRLR